MENVENQIALLHARVAALTKAKATLVLAQQEFKRTSQLVESDTASRELYDQRQAALSIARAGVVQALADVNQIRVFLGLQAQG
jgi:membrane fusion protein, multidrug efflux system